MPDQGFHAIELFIQNMVDIEANQRQIRLWATSLLSEPLLTYWVFTRKNLIFKLNERPTGLEPLCSDFNVESQNSDFLSWIFAKKYQVQCTLKEALDLTELFLRDQKRSLVRSKYLNNV